MSWSPIELYPGARRTERAGTDKLTTSPRTFFARRAHDPEKCEAFSLATNAETRLRGDHAQTIDQLPTCCHLERHRHRNPLPTSEVTASRILAARTHPSFARQWAFRRRRAQGMPGAWPHP